MSHNSAIVDLIAFARLFELPFCFFSPDATSMSFVELSLFALCPVRYIVHSYVFADGLPI